MNKSVLYSIFESLETFILLKQQNFIIYSWIHLKNRNKRIPHPHLQKADSISQQPPKQDQKIFEKTINPQNNDNTFRLTPRIPDRGRRLHTQNYRQLVFHDKLKQRMSDRLLTHPDKSNPNAASRPLFTTENAEAEIQDSDQFEDIVLQRLSTLQEGINKLMKEKREKEQKRGYVGSPLKPYPDLNTIVLQKDEVSDPSNQKIESILQRKKKFFDSLRKNSNHPHNIIHNLKYIPVNRLPQQEPTANIQRIKNLIQYNYQERIIDDIEYFNQNNARMVEQPNSHSRRLSTSLYMNRYNGTKQVRDKVHFRGGDIEMQTVIQPRKKYFRQGLVNTDRKPLKRSFISNNSVQARRNNLSSYN